jgi:sirohydrochlorin cobaltochelatase
MPIVLVASGTTTAAAATYRRIDTECRKRFPAHPLHWAYSSRVIRRRRREATGEVLPTPQAVLENLRQDGWRRAVVQSLHLICGIEFHRLVWQAAQSPLSIHLGLPLLATPEDFDALLEWVAAVRPTAAGEALVLVGHGTAHPAWMAYALLAQRLVQRFGETVFLGQVKGEPSPAAIARRLGATGCRRVQLRPFMLVAGAHFMQDIAGPQSASWQSQLAGHGLEVSAAAEGLGADPIPVGIFCRHITAALDGEPLDLA